MVITVHQEYIGEKKEKNPSHRNNRWWQVSQEEAHLGVWSVVNTIEKSQNYRRTLNIRYARLYNNLELFGFASYRGDRGVSPVRDENKLTYNIIKSCVDTAASKIAKNKPKPQFLTDGGNWSQQERAKLLTKYIEGIFYDSNVYEEAQRMFIDACVFGLGALKVFTEGNKIKVERIFPDELRVDEEEGINRKPRQMHQVKYVDRQMLIEQFPEYFYSISSASSASSSYDTESTADMIKVIESWHLPSSSEAKDGLHTIAIENCTLFREPWTKEYFPFVMYRWSEKLIGFFGQGLAEELVGIQIEINELLRNISAALNLIAVPRVIVDGNSRVSPSHITNGIGSIIKIVGGVDGIKFHTPQAMNAEVYQQLERLIRMGYEVTGISQMSASAKKPPGLDAAVAIREMNDLETERFMLKAQSWERSFLALSSIIIDLSRDLYEKDKKLSVKAVGSKFIKKIKWADVDLEDDCFVMQLFPTSLLPSQPGARKQEVAEWVQAGWITKDDAMSLLDFPDLEGFQSLEISSLNLIKKALISEGFVVQRILVL